MPDYDLLVVGEINPDLIVDGRFALDFGQAEELVDAANLTIGSSSAIFACGAARLGLKTTFVGACGDDLFGKFMIEQMNRRQVDTSYAKILPGGSTGLSVILNRGEDRMILTYPGLMNSLTAGDVSEAALKNARHLHVASYFIQDGLRPGLPDLFRQARRLGLSISLDTNYDPSEKWAGLDELLPLCGIFFPNRNEALAITGLSDPQEALLALGRICPRVVMKCGADGASLAHDGALLRAASIPVEVVDTVGAGDSFDAGFIYAYLNGWDETKALRLATVCGALSTRASGGTTAQAGLAEAVPFLQP